MDTYRSGWIVKHIGISRKTLESYEKRGYIYPARDAASNYRNYTRQDIETAWKIKQLVGVGFTHAEIKQLVGTAGMTDVTAIISGKIRELEGKLQQLEDVISGARQIERSGKLPPVPWPEEQTGKGGDS